MSYPKVTWDEEKLLSNAKRLDEICEGHGIDWIPVTKLVCANDEIINSLYTTGYREFSDSRILNIKKIKKLHPSCKTLLLRLPALSEINEVIQYVDTSLVSEWRTIEALNNEAIRQGKTHNIILMIDVGDLREGILSGDLDDIGERIIGLSGVKWNGIGTNLTCYGGVIPTTTTMSKLYSYKRLIEERMNYSLQIVSGGNSSSLPLVLQEDMPKEINQLRLGEALFLGRETAYGNKVDRMYNDIFTLEAEVIELKEKPSVPSGTIGMNAFGEKPTFLDRGIRQRAILAIGEQDVSVSGLVPHDKGMKILGASSDHLILDVSDSIELVSVGSIVKFHLNYKALLQVMTSSYVAIDRKVQADQKYERQVNP